jgi:hypothetical protein
MKMTFIKHLGSLRPADPNAEAFLAHTRVGQYVLVEAHRPRNPDHHRKFFAMLNIVLQNQEHYQSIDDLLDVCKLRTGHVKTIATKIGEVQIPKSISFASMDQTEFEAFYTRAVDWVCTEVVPGLERRDLDEEVANQLRKFAA